MFLVLFIERSSMVFGTEKLINLLYSKTTAKKLYSLQLSNLMLVNVNNSTILRCRLCISCINHSFRDLLDWPLDSGPDLLPNFWMII